MTDFAVERIIIACDAVAENHAGIEIAARLAAFWNTALHAVFLQDESLLNLAAFPFARQIGLGADTSESLDESEIIRHFEANASRFRASLEVAAREHAVASSFAVVRGQPTLAALSIDDRDFLVIEATARPFAGQFRLASRWLTAALEAHRPVLLVRNRGQTDDVLALVQAGGPSIQRMIAAAASLALAGNRKLTVRVLGEAASVDEVRAWVTKIDAGLGARCRIENVSRRDTFFEDGEGSILVVDANPAVNDLASLRNLAMRSRANILFVR